MNKNIIQTIINTIKESRLDESSKSLVIALNDVDVLGPYQLYSDLPEKKVYHISMLNPKSKSIKARIIHVRPNEWWASESKYISAPKLASGHDEKSLRQFVEEQ